ncbi:MAG: triose-phosphate isomerase [Candidatus Eremiobacteraeota bacterium]|nr:triose-phosphate isomerase [Candidatus Eremiobacteraeota bacterium]
MHKTVQESCAFVRALLAHDLPAGVEVAVCPPFTALAAVGAALEGSDVALGAQNMHEERSGAFTGEISGSMLQDLGVRYVILGHSERRRYFGETDGSVARKVRAALDAGLVPIVAVGESAEEHAAGETVDVVMRQTLAAFDRATDHEAAQCVVAYEPIWAIGTGNVDTPSGANAVMGAIRGCVPGLADARILYGGSMKPGNAAALLAEANIDGGLIGGASLEVAPFVDIIAAAAASLPEPL